MDRQTDTLVRHSSNIGMATEQNTRKLHTVCILMSPMRCGTIDRGLGSPCDPGPHPG